MARYAQTHLQLYEELAAAGYAEDEIGRVAAAYELAAELFSARFRGSGKPFLCHLVGTASILASLRAPAPLLLAALHHASYAQGEFGSGRAGVSAAKRAELREAIGERAEALAARFGELPWDEHSIPAFLAGVGALAADERDVLLLRLANELEDFLDLGALYGAHAEADRRWAKAVGPTCAELARRLGHPGLGAELERTLGETGSGRVSPLLRRSAGGSYLLAPRSHRRRARVALAQLGARAARAAGRLRRRLSRLTTP
jgi:(p)ppGpp synthase/HD superfamily hydrolase